MRKVKDARLELRLPAEMKEEIEAAARAEDSTPSQFMRRLFLDWKRRNARKLKDGPE